MLIIAYACAEFHDRTGAVIHRIRPADLKVFTTAPDAIRQDPLFDLMVQGGALTVPENKEEMKKLENDPELKVPEVKAPEEKTPESKDGNTAETKDSAAPAEEKKPGRKSAENK